ncbi:MAG: aminocarboxymuconate-semialdehyde decarboxylase [Flavobacteriales bacterium]|jgi:aminocarboxymuconate-semialdehyde decarboxylase
MLKIDMHTHIMPKELPRWAEKFGYSGFIHLEHHRPGFAKMMQDSTFFREVNENCWNPELRIKEYEKFDTQVQVVCTIPVLFSYWAKPKDCLEVSRFLNDDIADLVAKYPKNYIGLGTVPMQDPELAVQELERIKEIGLVGIQIGSNINEKNLNEPEFDVIWEACERLGLAVLVHPWNMMGKKHMEKYWLPWLVGMPAETSRAITSMIFGGIFDRFPKMRVNFAHAGGSFLPTIGRVEHGFNCRPDLVAVDNPTNPRDYIGKFWVDCITHDPMLLEYILKLQGSKKVSLGSDYPFPLGDLEIGKFITEMDLSPEVVDDIFCNSTLEWLDLDKKDFLS